MKKVKRISAANSKLVDFIESVSFSTSTLMTITMITYGCMDFAVDGKIESIYTHPIAYIMSVLAPVVTGHLITKYDSTSPTAIDIKDFKKSFSRIRKK